jgi:hypothetical protein
MDDFALATLAARADEAGGPPPTKFYELRDNLRPRAEALSHLVQGEHLDPVDRGGCILAEAQA